MEVGGVDIGGENPIVVQSMTNTDTSDVDATVAQIIALVQAGSELVRVTVNDDAAAEAVPEIVARLSDEDAAVPIVGDFHYNGHLLLTKYPACAEALAKYRINPGNVGTKHRDSNFQKIVKVAIKHATPVRIGVNWGSLDQRLLTEMMDANAERSEPKEARVVLLDAMVESATRSAILAEETGLGHDMIVLSAKVSEVPDLVEVYRMLADQCDYPLHLGLTEAGMGTKGIVATTAGITPLLIDGIGDTIRVSLTPEPGGDRTEEVRVARQILQSLKIRSFEPQVTACPGCGRTTSSLFQEMAQDIETYIREKMPGVEWGVSWRRESDGGGNGVYRERPGRVEARRSRDLIARHGRRPEGPGVRGRRASFDAPGRGHGGRVQGDCRRVHPGTVRVIGVLFSLLRRAREILGGGHRSK